MSVGPEHPSRARRPEWAALRSRVLARAEHHCEACGALNYSTYAIDEGGSGAQYWRGWAANGASWARVPANRIVRRILTIAHLCKCSPPCLNAAHVQALCQKCHLALDLERHQAAAKKTRIERKDARRPLLAAIERAAEEANGR